VKNTRSLRFALAVLDAISQSNQSGKPVAVFSTAAGDYEAADRPVQEGERVMCYVASPVQRYPVPAVDSIRLSPIEP
jgi:hypothetical protein